jgi:hypothetical protein
MHPEKTTMLHWYATYPLPTSLEELLSEAEVFAGKPDTHKIDLWIYDTPDRILGSWWQRYQCIPPLKELVTAYVDLVSQATEGRLTSGWRLEQLNPLAVRSWLLREDTTISGPAFVNQDLPPIGAIEGQLALRIMEDSPELLDAYLDLELRSDLIGTHADSAYLERLLGTSTSEALLGALNELHTKNNNQLNIIDERNALLAERNSISAELAEAKKEAREAILQLHQVQEELERYFLIASEQSGLLKKQNNLTINALKLAGRSPRSGA